MTPYIFLIFVFSGQSQSPGKDRVDSPTPQTDPDKGKATNVQGIMGNNQRIKVVQQFFVSHNAFRFKIIEFQCHYNFLNI